MMGKNCPKHVELILEINEFLLLHPIGFSILLYLESVPFGASTFADTVTSVVCLDMLEEFPIPSRFWEKRVQKTS
jgi:hypothetical protein